jgi:hypothetical protein
MGLWFWKLNWVKSLGWLEIGHDFDEIVSVNTVTLN